MQYYLLIGGKSSGPFEENELLKAYEDGDIDESSQVRPEKREDWLPLGSILTLEPTPALSSSPASDSEGEDFHPADPTWPSPRSYLQDLRENTCYGVLRTIIEVATFVLIASAALSWLVPIASILLHRSIGGFDLSNLYGVPAPVWLAVDTVVFLLTIILVIGLRQAALLLIDIADTLLWRHSGSAHPL